MQLHVLGSSSKGNCYILKTDTGSLLLDCGVGMKQIKKALDYNLSDIKGCLVSHEHGDHSHSVQDLIDNAIDIYMSAGTAEALNQTGYRITTLKANLPVVIDDFYILPFDVQHDCAEPLGFVILYIPTGEQLLFATDTYYIKYNFSNINYFMLECNYDPEILEENVEAGRVHPIMRDRLISSHFSLPHVLEFIKANDMSTVKKIILMHLSDTNSDAAKMRSAVVEQSQRPVCIAEPGMVIELTKHPF